MVEIEAEINWKLYPEKNHKWIVDHCWPKRPILLDGSWLVDEPMPTEMASIKMDCSIHQRTLTAKIHRNPLIIGEKVDKFHQMGKMNWHKKFGKLNSRRKLVVSHQFGLCALIINLADHCHGFDRTKRKKYDSYSFHTWRLFFFRFSN